jgi:heptosyltransferase I
MHVLIVKVSSLGDVIHTLPAVTDAAHARRDLRFDWVVEEAFAEIPAWHPAVDKVIPVAFRRWRKHPLQTWRSGEFAEFKRKVQERHYDLVIDAQGLIKSGIISRLSRGLTVGLSNRTIREPLATLFYNVVYSVPWQQHAVERVRELFSRTFNYSYDYKTCDYGLNARQFKDRPLDKEPYVVFFHGTTWDSKLWPDNYWQKLAQIAGQAGYKVKVLWGNAVEQERARKIALAGSHVEILDRLSLTKIAGLLAASSGAVAVDTGLGHLGAALSIPVISIYGSSDPARTGTHGRGQIHLQSSLDCAPCMKKRCLYKGEALLDTHEGKEFSVEPPCYRSNSPELVWDRLVHLNAGGKGTLDTMFYPG